MAGLEIRVFVVPDTEMYSEELITKIKGQMTRLVKLYKLLLTIKKTVAQCVAS